MPDESYIVRIYRRAETTEFMTDKNHGADDITGTVKDVEDGVWRPFHNKDELWRIVVDKKYADEGPHETTK